ncbi:ferredoxin [Phaffia rhodozyma]|uniref:Ferredoxin n=1 Tax=Phaffia rhodozyma TaxID=264483 RepID=A0A0F7SS43_PHARH|nr:ferredoxin [Phaffia rhodozyma]
MSIRTFTRRALMPTLSRASCSSTSAFASVSSASALSSFSDLRRSTTLFPCSLAGRSFSSSPISFHGDWTPPEPGKGVKVIYKDSKGKVLREVMANEGDDLLTLAHEHDVDLEGACERSVACSTCHVILEPEMYDAIEEPSDEENDMLDLAFGLTDTSRLGCQVIVTKEMDGISVSLPSATRNMFVDGAKPTKH